MVKNYLTIILKSLVIFVIELNRVIVVNVQQTSISAYISLIEDPEYVARCQSEVLTVIRANGDLTNTEIADKLDWSINRVTPRVKELRVKGLVITSQKRECFCTICNVQRGMFKDIPHRVAIAWKIGKL